MYGETQTSSQETFLRKQKNKKPLVLIYVMHLTFGSVQIQEGRQARAEGEGKVTTGHPLVVRLTHYKSWLEPVPLGRKLDRLRVLASQMGREICGESVPRVFLLASMAVKQASIVESAINDSLLE